MPKLSFFIAEISVEAPFGSELLSVKEKYPDLPLRFSCTRGDCGTCVIKPLKGAENLSECTKIERATLKKLGKLKGYRLACQCALEGDVEVE